MSLYKYDGPVYMNGRKISDREVLYTNADTDAQARKNLWYRIGKDKDILYNCVSKVVSDYKELVPSVHCDRCGNLLADSGRCPLCDDSDYSILDDIKLLTDIEED